MTPEELEKCRESQENESIKGIWGQYARCRNLTFDEICEKINNGEQWTLRLKSPGTLEGKCFFDDMIKGKIEMPENVQDVVILKSDGIPTYHRLKSLGIPISKEVYDTAVKEAYR